MVEVKELYEQLCLRVPVKQYDAGRDKGTGQCLVMG